MLWHLKAPSSRPVGRQRWIAFLVVVTLAWVPTMADGQAAPIRPSQKSVLDSLIVAHSHFIGIDRDSLIGPGAKLILDAAVAAQFVALGEQHNTREIPEITRILFLTLRHRGGYRYLAIEQDPVTMGRISKPPVRGNLDSIVAISRRYPHAFTFVGDDELRMLAAVGRMSSATTDPIWGCEQAFGLAHILDRLVAIDSTARRIAGFAPMRDTAFARERVRDLARYAHMGQPHQEGLQRLWDAMRLDPSSEAAFLLQSAIISNRIYRNHPVKRYDANFEREEYMKSRFMTEYRRAMSSGETMPRVLLKHGHWHLFRGLGPGGLQTLGNFVSELAVANGQSSVHVAFYPNNAPGGYGDLSAGSDPLLRRVAKVIGRERSTIVDLRPLRPHFAHHGNALEEIPVEEREALRRWIFGFDYAWFVVGMRQTSYDFNPGVKY